MSRFLAMLFLFLLAGCAGKQLFNEGRALIESGEVEAGLARVQEAARLEPGNREYRAYYFRQRDLALQRQLAGADEARRTGKIDEAEAALRTALALDPANGRARSAIEALQMDRRHVKLLAEAEAALKRKDIELAHAKTREVLAANPSQRDALVLLRRIELESPPADAVGPQLRAVFRKPITVEFRDGNLRTIFELIAKNTGLNFLFDRDVRADLRTTVFLKNTSVEDVIRFLLVTNQLEQKVLNDSTLLIYPRTPAKLSEYRDLVTKTFYVGNADVKQMINLLRTIVRTKDVYVDEKLNIVVMRDTPEAVRMAERLLAGQDLAEPEVMLEVEVLEVSSSKLSEIGIRYPDQVSFSLVGAGGTPGTVTLPEWLNRGSDLVRISFTNPLFVLNFRDQIGRANLLANPRIRVKNREKARVHIGDKVPIITTTTTATGFAAETVSYVDVGLKLDVEPLVHLENDVGMKVGLEVSSLVREIRSASGTLTYQIGTRLATTSLRLRDGETQVLAGLISDEDRSTTNRVPGLGELPVVGRLFGSQADTANKTEVVLLITPRVVRNLSRPDFRATEFLSGTEAAAGAAPLRLETAAPPAVPALAGVSAAPEPTNPQAALAGPTKISLQAPGRVLSGQEFKLIVNLSGTAALRSAILEFAFDPNRFVVVAAEAGESVKSAGEGATVQSSAPDGFGRLTVSITSKKDIAASGELAVVTLRPINMLAANTTIRLEAVSLTDSNGRVVTATLPPPQVLSLVK